MIDCVSLDAALAGDDRIPRIKGSRGLERRVRWGAAR
jgi:hypothetical protein